MTTAITTARPTDHEDFDHDETPAPTPGLDWRPVPRELNADRPRCLWGGPARSYAPLFGGLAIAAVEYHYRDDPAYWQQQRDRAAEAIAEANRLWRGKCAALKRAREDKATWSPAAQRAYAATHGGFGCPWVLSVHGVELQRAGRFATEELAQIAAADLAARLAREELRGAR